MHFGIDPDKFYRPKDLAERGLATQILLAQWRCRGEGPPFVKVTTRVLYSGHDVIEWLNRQRVETRDAGAPVAA